MIAPHYEDQKKHISQFLIVSTMVEIMVVTENFIDAFIFMYNHVLSHQAISTTQPL